MHAFCGHKIAQQITADGQNRKEPCDERHTAAHQCFCAIDLFIGKQGKTNADQKAGQSTAHGAEGGKRLPVVRVCGDGRSHGTVGNVDGGIKNRTPENIGDEQIHNFKCHGKMCQTALIHQK